MKVKEFMRMDRGDYFQNGNGTSIFYILSKDEEKELFGVLNWCNASIAKHRLAYYLLSWGNQKVNSFKPIEEKDMEQATVDEGMKFIQEFLNAHVRIMPKDIPF